MSPHPTGSLLAETVAAAVDRYDEICAAHRWNVPARFNIGNACCGRWANDRARFALYWEDESGARAAHTFWDLQQQANRLSNALVHLGVRAGDKVALVLPQRPETVVAHLAVYQLGGIAVPLSFLFGPDALEYRIVDSESKVVFVDPQSLPNLASIRDRCPGVTAVIGVAGAREAWTTPYESLIERGSRAFEPVVTSPADPAILVYTSGTTGPPKGALMPHQCLLGNLPGFVHSHNGYPREGDLFWSPADWAWTGGLMDALLPTLYFGQPIVGYRGRFDPDHAFALMAKYGVRNVFLFPTALKMMMKAAPRPIERYDLQLRSIMSAGEALGTTVFEWARDALGVTINEMFGQTEMNYIVGNSHALWPAKPGSMGRPYPGHRIAVIDDDGNAVPDGEIGEVAIDRIAPDGSRDPIFFLGYFKNPEGTASKFAGDWCRTGDLAKRDADGYLWYQGRADDMFKAAGYRIGPSEIENCLVRHPAVANAAVVPSPDETRGNIVKAFVVLAAGHTPSAALLDDIQQHVRSSLAPYEYPREIEFIDALPMTTTGKVQRRVLRERERVRKAVPGSA
jgi:acetyl-CoA synthetase